MKNQRIRPPVLFRGRRLRVAWPFCLALGCVFGTPMSGERPKDADRRSVRVEDVQHILAEDRNARDAQVAQQLAGLELSERINTSKLESLEKIVPGAKSRSALMALADASAFLRPPASDVLSKAPPDLSEQRRMIALTVDYLGKTLPKLPDFYATETTIRYDGDALKAKRVKGTSHRDSTWREVGRSTVVVAYRDGKETVDPSQWSRRPLNQAGQGLITKGTFGPILSTVIVDAAHGDMEWDHWEGESTGVLAVFCYRVPENQSHYSVAFRLPFSDTGPAEQASGYHGEVAIDPATGTILRLTVQADLPSGSPILQGDIAVEYGPIEIGGQTYTCPIRSVSISLDAAGPGGGVGPFGRSARISEVTLLNDVSFTDYHLFRSSSRILTENIPMPNP